MGELGSGKSHNQQEHHHHLFTVGSEVEVAIDEEGFKGAWFRATILKLPTNFSPSKKKKALIEYKTLVCEDELTPLKENVDIVSLRPVPPDIADKDIEEGDIVDAVDQDGWWTGIVRKILENTIYNVFFENPLHVIDFERNKLRFHQDFVDGKWVRPQKRDVLTLPDLKGNGFKDVPEEKSQPKSSKTDETNIEQEVPYSINSRNDLMEQPGICYEKTAAFASTPNKKKRKLSSLSDTIVSHPSKLGEGNLPGAPAAIEAVELRKTGSKTPSRKTLRGMAISHSVGKGKCHSRIPCANGNESTDKNESPGGGEKARSTEPDRSGELDMQGTKPVNDDIGNTLGPSPWTQVTDKEGKDNCEVIEMTPKDVRMMEQSQINNQLTSELKWMVGLPAANALKFVNKAREKGMESEQQQASGNSQRRKRGRPRKLLIAPKATGDKEQDGNDGNSDQGVIEGCTSDFQVVHRRNGNTPAQCKTKEVENNRVSSNVDDDDRPLLMWFGGIQCLAGINASRRTTGKNAKQRAKGSEQINVANKASVIDGTSDRAPVTNQDWPFIKNSPIWKAIESLEVFKIIPQMPHFRPLNAFKEECREGLAIGNMVTFASLVEKISKLQFDNPRHIFESTLESLFDLEQHGFDISLLCNRVNELLSIKGTQIQYQDKMREAETKILEHNQEKTILAKEIEAIEQKIAELQKKHTSIKMEMETKDHETTWLQSHVDAIRECTLNSRVDFEKLAALPLKRD